jgi:hexosaminidase
MTSLPVCEPVCPLSLTSTMLHYRTEKPMGGCLRFSIVSMMLLAFACWCHAEPLPKLNLMPMPASVRTGSGELPIDASFSVGIRGASDGRLRRSVDRFLAHLRRQLAMPPQSMKLVDASQAVFVVHADRASKTVQELGEDESYTLEVSSSGAQLNARTTLGVMRGLQTFLQLVQTTPTGFAAPAVVIRDEPRFPWRGLMIDVSRHFIPIEVLKRNLDGMAAVKLNVFHWHLSDDQGFRVESKKLPKLQEMGSEGLFYTQDEVRDLIAYAADRGIRVIPEFDMPGHTTAWFVGYPELASGPGPYEIERKWGVFDPAMDPTQERTYKFLNEFIGEMARLFPDKYFHIGGDELNGKQWDANPKIQEFKRAHGLKTNLDLQAYFSRRVGKIIAKHGKIMIGWDEILHSDLPADTVLQSWHEQTLPADSAKQGYKALLSLGYYLDLMWPASQHYAVDPMRGAGGLTEDEKQRILGGEACMWSEYVSPESIDSRVWPRMAAIAERLWSPQNVTDVKSMYERLDQTSHELEWLRLTHNSSYAPMLRRIAGGDDISALRVLADVAEPVKDYTREEIAAVPATNLTPLNRLVDAVRPESATARQFAEMVDALLSGRADSSTRERIKALLTRWRDNQAELRPLEEQSFLMKEVVPLSQNLSELGEIGLDALNYLDRGTHAPDSWKAERLTLIDRAEMPQAQLLLTITASLRKLVQASAAAATSAQPK